MENCQAKSKFEPATRHAGTEAAGKAAKPDKKDD
jgi:hypothetical protein